MTENLRIFGFKNPHGIHAAMLITVLISDSGEFYVVWPDTSKQKIEPSATEERMQEEAFVPPSDPANLVVWRENQVAYLDRNEKVHVGLWEELVPIIKADLPYLDVEHREWLGKDLEEPVKK